MSEMGIHTATNAMKGLHDVDLFTCNLHNIKDVSVLASRYGVSRVWVAFRLGEAPRAGRIVSDMGSKLSSFKLPTAWRLSKRLHINGRYFIGEMKTNAFTEVSCIQSGNK